MSDADTWRRLMRAGDPFVWLFSLAIGLMLLCLVGLAVGLVVSLAA